MASNEQSVDSSDTLISESEDIYRTTDSDAEDFNWHFSLDGYWDDVDERFYGEDSPNEPPLLNVPEKLAADIEYIDDDSHAVQVAEQLGFDNPSNYEAVIKVTFNDFSTWNWPLYNGNREFTSAVEHYIDRYFPEILQWQAIVTGQDPQEALDEWRGDKDEPDFSWIDDFDNTDISEEHREFFNENADWLPHIDREVDSSGLDVEIEEGDGSDWTDDW